MRIDDASRAAETVVDELGLADYDEEYDLYQALVADERFGAACYLYQELGVYATGDEATEADREALECLKRSLREHAQRVSGAADLEEMSGDV